MGSASLKVTEPSMEDILASIRRIIAEDPETEVIEAASPLKSVLDIAERHVAPVAPVLPAEEPSVADDGDFGEHFDSQVAAMNAPFFPQNDDARIEPVLPVESAVPAAERRRAEPLLSPQTRSAVSDSFDRLGAAVMPQQPRTVEDLMKEMLRPMLREWLDENLPPIVERLVQAEIERVARDRD